LVDLFDAMKVVVAVVEAGSLSAAARRIGMPLATVSRKVSELEASLNTRLLTRSSRQLALTDAGQAYFLACKRILEQVAEAERAASGEYRAPTGEMTIATPVAFGRLHVLPIANEFLRAYPNIDLRMILSDRISHLLDDHIDVAVRLGELPDSSLVASRVGEIRRVVCASPDYFAMHGRPLTPSDLTAHDCVTFDQLMSAEGWSFLDGKSEMAVAIHSRLVVNTADAAIDAAIAGVGITRVLSYQAASGLRDGTLVLALESFEPAPWPVSLVHAAQGPLPLKVRAFIDFAAPRLKARLVSLAN
jgi:DNA-binding transcriptional LysR family regulator